MLVQDKSRIYKLCDYCDKEYFMRPGIAFNEWLDKSRFCSRLCMQKVNPGGFKSGQKAWNEGLKYGKETRLKISETQTGRIKSEVSKEKQRQRMLGRKITWADKISKSRRGQATVWGDKHWNWRGGISSENHLIRNSFEMKVWRKTVFERDNYTCVICGARSGKNATVILNADHIKPFAQYPELRFELSNGRTLCKPCHIETDSYGRKGWINHA